MSKMEEEFYFVRCTVADMKNLYVNKQDVELIAISLVLSLDCKLNWNFSL